MTQNNTQPIPSNHPKNQPKQSENFPIAGLGASAGGLEALEQFFHHIPADTGMAFVLISHLDPTHASILTEILQRTTSMQVLEAQDQMQVIPNCVYVIPPNRDMTIFKGALQLTLPAVPHGQRMPIDTFLRSLAEDQAEKTIGIVLSGTGTDGTLGLRAILGAGGITLAQEPSTAKFDGMPVSAIQAGYVTHILPVEKMPEVLLSGILSQIPQAAPSPPIALSGINHILMQLRTAIGHDFSLYKKSTITRRIQRRMSQNGIEDTETYARYLKEHPSETTALFKELLINVTNFFRDPEAFVTLKQDILPALLADKPDNYVFRIWVAGCATGEETYSIAMVLREVMDKSRREIKVQLYSTDLSEDTIAVARAGLYPPNISVDVTPERLRRFFVKEERGYRIKKEIREMVVFAVQNIIKDPPFTKLDLLSCRNLMIYLEPELQNRLIPAFHYALKPGGVLFLSPSESIGNHTDLFTPLNRKWKFYRTIPSPASTHAVLASNVTWATESTHKTQENITKVTGESNLAELTRRILLQSYAPAAAVTDTKGHILYIYGETGKYLRPAPGLATLNVVDMAREGLQLELRAAIMTASQNTSVLHRELSVKTNGDFQPILLSVRPLSNPNDQQPLLLISFQDIEPNPSKPAPGKHKRASKPDELRHIEELECELAYTKENLQATIEEQFASNEELKCANEELQSTNEELQSTNEELETSKEELQSINEELITVNSELQAKIVQLADMQNDMKNLLDNIHIGTIFLDQNMTIRRFTREATNIYRLAASDIGRSLSDIKPELKGEDLLDAAHSVLDNLVPIEREVKTLNDNSYLARVQPYRTLENMIDGVVLTFTNVTERAADIAKQKAELLAECIIKTVHEPLLVLNNDLIVVTASRSFYQDFQVSAEETVGRPIYELGNGQWNIPDLRNLLETVLPHNQAFENYLVEHNFPAIGYRKILLNARSIISQTGDPQLIVLAMTNITDKP
ncbi:chemotaxis protein CheB [Candidatus Methylobacter oryzae]|uniref:protein-glutamate O-methyltransferase n=1 Tax=Candidatus Methylobacter oryzae TaxID=2497749 RepID=A0ABY3C4L4_9GAMM|nr:chemotaxis protein CheB [Candidatus Methylobacter oryzae]TRW89659.1 SAM-dependent methyltransferase [Candidatus Methylobacter oryzae]